MIPVKFPSAEQRGTPKVNTGNTLEVVRFSPEGEVNLAPDLSVTFSQPMVAVTSQEQAAQVVPVELSPQTEGKWRWLGNENFNVRRDEAFADGNEIYRSRSCRNKICQRSDLG
jgi:hypothetical protein